MDLNLLEATPISDEVLRAVYASDQDMYPVALSYERLCSWVAAYPELSIGFSLRNERSSSTTAAAASDLGDVYGVIIVLPLRRVFWEKLLDGRLKEQDIEAWSMFPPVSGLHTTGEVAEVGLHVYHVERFPSSRPKSVSTSAVSTEEASVRTGFAGFALGEVLRRARAKRDWRVVGISAITATPSGKRTFETLGFAPTGYREAFVATAMTGTTGDAQVDGQVEMISIGPQHTNDEPGDEQTKKIADGRAIISVYEMAVKYV